MKNFRVFLAGSLLGFVAALVPSCGPTTHCTAANCAGCCTAAGKCSLGTTAAACGKNGSVCVSCTGQNGCVDGMCMIGGAGGGDANGGGVATNGGGVATGGGHPTGGSGTGGGHTGGGAGGGAGMGGGMQACTVSSCADGCCVGSTCVHPGSQSDTQCGMGGFGCLSCAGGNHCVNAQCVGTTTCGPSNCTGCCSGNACQAFGQQGAGSCGSGGNACAPCNGGETCMNGGCVQPATLGGPCGSTADCASLGTGATCKLNTSTGNAPYPQGYCTLPCSAAQSPGDPCGSGQGECIGGSQDILPYYGEGDFMCASTCPQPGTQSDCRNGYACYGDGWCWLNPIPDFDGGGVATKVGNACTTDTQCQNPPSALFGFCVAATGSSGATGFTGGYCSADCDFDNTGRFCGPNGACFGFDQDDGGTFAACLRTCPTPGGGHSTRTGYSCFTAVANDGGTIGYLFPACDAPGNPCPANFFCNAASGYCCDGGNCIN